MSPIGDVLKTIEQLALAVNGERWSMPYDIPYLLLYYVDGYLCMDLPFQNLPVFPTDHSSQFCELVIRCLTVDERFVTII